MISKKMRRAAVRPRNAAELSDIERLRRAVV
jgi:hypothetical protein